MGNGIEDAQPPHGAPLPDEEPTDDADEPTDGQQSDDDEGERP